MKYKADYIVMRVFVCVCVCVCVLGGENLIFGRWEGAKRTSFVMS